jgi:hypothetical protein
MAILIAVAVVCGLLLLGLQANEDRFYKLRFPISTERVSHGVEPKIQEPFVLLYYVYDGGSVVAHRVFYDGWKNHVMAEALKEAPSPKDVVRATQYDVANRFSGDSVPGGHLPMLSPELQKHIGKVPNPPAPPANSPAAESPEAHRPGSIVPPGGLGPSR